MQEENQTTSTTSTPPQQPLTPPGLLPMQSHNARNNTTSYNQSAEANSPHTQASIAGTAVPQLHTDEQQAQHTYDATKQQLYNIQKAIRSLNRKNKAKWQAEQEEQLREATRRDNKAEQQKICRLLAGQQRGILKRRYNQLLLRQPLKAEIHETATSAASEGGLGGKIIDFEAEKRNGKRKHHH